MKAEILKFPWQIEKLLEFIERSQKEIMIVVPFYRKPEIDEILRRVSKDVKLRTLLRANSDSDIGALESLCKRGEVRSVPNLHAKILIFDRSIAIVSSLNLDSSWEIGSLDVGVLLRGKACKKLVALADEWWEKGKQVSQKEIDRLKTAQEKAKTTLRIPAEKTRFIIMGKHIQAPPFEPKMFEERHLMTFDTEYKLEPTRLQASVHSRRS